MSSCCIIVRSTIAPTPAIATQRRVLDEVLGAAGGAAVTVTLTGAAVVPAAGVSAMVAVGMVVPVIAGVAATLVTAGVAVTAAVAAVVEETLADQLEVLPAGELES